MNRFVALLLVAMAAVPMGWALWGVAAQSADAQAWQAFWADPQTLRAWGMTLWTGMASALLVWVTLSRLLAHAYVRRQLLRQLAVLPAFLATPHAAMAIGLVLWLAPSGWALRALSPWLTGMDAPPAWSTTQDPWGLGLILVLWLKELPFMLWVAATHMQRDDVRHRWQAEYTLAQTLGRTPSQAFAQVVWPQLAQRLRWPALAVLAYGLTVVDMALVVGPTAPPTLAVLAWQWLGDADAAMQAQGVAAALWLTASVALLAALQVRAEPLSWRVGTWVAQMGRGHGHLRRHSLLWWSLVASYAGVAWALGVGSVSGVWPFPQVLPTLWTGDAWLHVWGSAQTVWTTLGLAVASATGCLLWAVAWLEWSPRSWQKALRPAWLLPLVLPAVLWVVGLYSLALHWRLEGQWLGLLLAHAVMVLPYVLLALEPAYQSVDPRQWALVASLGHGRWHYVWRIKWPLLRRALNSAWAVGFAVSVAQYLPTLYVGAGRYATVTTEAVTLAAGAQRNMLSAYAALQVLLPVLVFALASRWGRPRQFEKIGSIKVST